MTWGGKAGEPEYRDLEAQEPLEQISVHLTKMTKNVTDLKKMVDQLGTPSDNHQLRERLDVVRTETKDLSKTILSIMKASPGGDKAKQDKLRKQFQVTLKQFEEVSSLSVKKERDIVHRMSGSHGQLPGMDAMKAEMSSKKRVESDRVGDLDIQLVEQAIDEQALRERNEGIRQIEKDLVELHECFTDLAMLVTEQQTALDTIEANVSQTDAAVERGVEELDLGLKYQKAARKKMCCVIAIILIIIGVVIAIIAGSGALKS